MRYNTTVFSRALFRPPNSKPIFYYYNYVTRLNSVLGEAHSPSGCQKTPSSVGFKGSSSCPQQPTTLSRHINLLSFLVSYVLRSTSKLGHYKRSVNTGILQGPDNRGSKQERGTGLLSFIIVFRTNWDPTSLLTNGHPGLM